VAGRDTMPLPLLLLCGGRGSRGRGAMGWPCLQAAVTSVDRGTRSPPWPQSRPPVCRLRPRRPWSCLPVDGSVGIGPPRSQLLAVAGGLSNQVTSPWTRCRRSPAASVPAAGLTVGPTAWIVDAGRGLGGRQLFLIQGPGRRKLTPPPCAAMVSLILVSSLPPRPASPAPVAPAHPSPPSHPPRTRTRRWCACLSSRIV